MSAKRYQERSAAKIQTVLGNGETIRRFAMKYGNTGTKLVYLSILKDYFAWLESKGIVPNPDTLVSDNLFCVFKSDATDVRTKRRHRDLMNEYVNVHLKEGEYSFSYRRNVVSAISGFYKANDSELFGDFQLATQNVTPPKKALKAEDIRLVLKALPVNIRTPLLVEWQSGIEINRVLSLTWKELTGFEKGEYPVRVDLFGRKGHRRSYCTFLGRDSTNHIKTLDRTADHVFVAKGGGYMNAVWLNRRLRTTAMKLSKERIIDEYPPDSWHSHALRHSFSTECSHAKVRQEIREYWLGHVQGVAWIYQHGSEIHPEDLVSEYCKVEPFISLDPNESIIRSEFEGKEKSLIREVEALRRLYEELKEEIQSGQNASPSPQSNA